MAKINLGSVSSGTMRKEDLIPCFMDELRSYDKDNSLLFELDAVIKNYAETNDLEYYYDSELSNYDLDNLFNELNNINDLPYVYFGSHPGDGSDYGYWIDESIQYDFEGLKVDDTSEIPDNYNGEVLHVNDHGNMTLYAAIEGELTEIWSIV